MSQTLYVMQGPPGSGKTRLAWLMADGIKEAVICSTDDYFIDGGTYRFRPEMLAQFHRLNLQRAVLNLQLGRTVIVDNTNIKRWQCRPYVEFAVNNGIPVVFIRVNGTFNNVHGVPAAKVEQMRIGMEDLDVASVLNSKSPMEG